MNTLTEQNKAVVLRFNQEVISEGKMDVIEEIFSHEFVNHTAMQGISQGIDGMVQVIQALREGFPDLHVEVYDQIAEGDKVVTRKKIFGTHYGEFMGIYPTGKPVEISIFDIVMVKDGKYLAHWGSNNLPTVIAQLKEEAALA